MKLYNKEELKDSRIFFDKKPPRYMTVFIILFFFFLISVFIIAKNVTKPYIVKAQGSIVTEDTSYVTSKGSGIITEIFAESGEQVKKGDVLLAISSGEEGLQASVLQKRIDDLNETLDVLDRYEESLKNDKNLLKNKGEEMEYYGKMQYYLDLLDEEKYNQELLMGDLAEVNAKVEQVEIEIGKLQSKLREGEASNETYQTTKSGGENALEEKKLERDQLLTSIEKIEQELENAPEEDHDQTTLQNDLHDKLNELEEIEQEILSNESDLRNSTSQREKIQGEISEVKSNLDIKETEKEGFQEEIKQIEQQLENPNSQAKVMFNQQSSELGQKRNEVLAMLTELQASLNASEERDNVHYVHATQTGIIHFITPISLGVSIQQNKIIGEIAEDGNDFYIEAFINASDRSRIAIGNEVNVSVIGVNNYQFGTLPGTIDFIEPGTLESPSSDEPLIAYKAKILLKENQLDSRDGDRISLNRSMPVETNVVYEEETYLSWALNLLNLKKN